MISIIIPFYKNIDTIEHLLRSINDQDYKDYDVTIVIDGKDDDAELKLREYQNVTSFVTYVLDQNAGASVARNYGAKMSSGDILFFIDADCKLYPGMLRECVTQFELNPDVSFVYGNYRFNNYKEFYSQGFDPYLLETMNYICTMSPVKREAFDAVKGFDDRKYFQDWGLFYKLAKAGYKGKYIKEFIFTTKESDEKNISGTQGLTLAEKCEEFRSYYGIKHKDLVVTTFGAPLQAMQRAKMLEADYVGGAKDSKRMVLPGNYGFNWKGTYMVGCYNETLPMLENHMSTVIGKPIYHFIGTDVFQMYNTHSIFILKKFKEAFELQKAKLFANSPRCVRELSECGLDAELLYTPIEDIGQYQPSELPKDFTVGVYYSDTNPMHFLDGGGGRSNLPLILEVAKCMPDVKFKLFGGEAMYTAGNVEFCGRFKESEMADFIKSCSMVVRSTIHDGFPQLPIQFLLSGRQALVSCPDEELKYMDKLSFEDALDWENNKEELINKIYKCVDNPVDNLKLSADAHKYYGELMSVDKFKKRIYEVLND